MIAHLEGVVSEVSPTRVIVDVNGLGYEVSIPVSTFDKIGNVGAKVKLITYLHVREDAMQLFGFSTLKEKLMFSNLISVGGVGPKLALVILSGRSVDELNRSIATGDVTSLTQISGVGKKTGQRIVMELKDKLSSQFSEGEISPVLTQKDENNKMEEGILALVSLGYSRERAQNTLRKILAHQPDLALDELIKKALQSL